MRLPLLLLAATLGGTACGTSTEEKNQIFTTRFVDSDMATDGAHTALATRSALAARSAAVRGLRFGELEVVAYDYRPGQSVQLNASFGSGRDGAGATEWSYMAPLLSGHESARDILLENNGVVDLAELANGYALAGAPAPGDPFVSTVGAFDIDFFEINFYRTGMLYDMGGMGNVADFHYFGMDADGNGLDKHPLHRYPRFASVGDSFAMPIFPDWKAHGPVPRVTVQAMSVLFARKDWFPEARIVELENSGAGGFYTYVGIGYDSLAASKPLTATQSQILVSLANEGTSRRGYERFVIIPMDGPIRVEFDAKVAAGAKLDPPVAARSFPAANFSVDVGFNIDQLIDERWTNPVPHEFNAPGGEGSVVLEVVNVESPGSYTLSYAGIDYSIQVPAGLGSAAEVANALVNEGRSVLPPQARLGHMGEGAIGESGWDLPPLGSSDSKLKLIETLPKPHVVWSGDANFVPFGLTVEFSSAHPLCPANQAFDASKSCHSVGLGQPAPPNCCVCPSGTTYSPVPGSGGQRMCK